MRNFRHTGFKQWVIGLSLTVVLSAQLLVGLTPAPANAQFGAPDVVAALSAKWSSESVTEGVLASSLGALVNGFSYFMRKLAYDSAVWIANGGKGQGALVFQQGAGDYFKSVALDSAASAIEQFGSPLGLDLCKPPDLRFQIFLQVSLRKLYEDPSLAGGPKPNCSWNEFSSNWDNGFKNFDQKAGDFASQMFAKSLRVDQSDMGVALGVISKVDRINAQAQAGAQTSRTEGQGYKAVTDLISGNIKTPAQVIAEETKALTGNKQQDLTSQQIAGIYGAGLWQVIPAAGGVFLNTLVSQFMSQIFEGGLLPDASDVAQSGGGASSVFSEYAGVISSNRAAAQNAFNFLFTAVPTQELTTYPLLEKFSDCSNPENPGLNNCVADPGLVQAVKQAKSGNAFTIREAMDRKNNLLHADWALVPPNHEFNSDPKKCYNSGYYCYSNLQKLRKARIFPLGMEIAASKADPDQLQNWTLEKVVNGFYDCDSSGQPTPSKPFCHLIDPDWIIRLPEPRCDSLVNGPRLLATDNPVRSPECADVSTCLAEDDKGNCLGNYGYCLREKNTWQFGGSSCPEQFSSCTSYVNNKDSSRVSYLSRTIETGQCNAQSVGCQPYSLLPTIDGSWQNTSVAVTKDEIRAGKNKVLHFNEAVKNYSCPSSADGCSALFTIDATGNKGEVVHLKKAPANLFEACYLVTKPGTTEKVWPQTAGEIAEIAARPEAKLCAAYAPACTKDDAGCEAYKPTAGGDTVTGVVGANQCAQSCVGYDTFKQEVPENKGAFEPTQFPLQFIPSQAQSCSAQYEGCSEFTNIDAAAAGGEKLEYYSDLNYCEKPTGNNQKVFYSWEGTVSEGYVLRTHKLRPISAVATDRYSVPPVNSLAEKFPAGSPAYVDGSLDALSNNNNECNATTYTAAVQNPYGINTAKPDCRALYDDTGAVYYRLLSKTVTVSDACHPLRKTDSFLRVDPDLTQQNTESLCTAKGGKWTGGANSKCEVCYNGGIYQNGACIYYTTSQPSDAKSCPQTANNCRAYTGKAANNTQTILEQKFEPQGTEASALAAAKAGWQGGTIKPESLTVGQYSLEVTTDQIDYAFVSSTLENSKFYELEFWSRGAAQNLDVQFFDTVTNKVVGVFTLDPVTNQTVKAPISTTWQAYRLGPVQFTGVGANNIVLRFKRSLVGAAGPYYLDNIRLTKVSEKIFLVKNSWKRTVTVNGAEVVADAPLACDANPSDGLPGAALGCRAYTNSVGASLATTGFDRLCKPQAVGCRALVDTRNTVNETRATGYNLWCAGAQNTTCTLKVGTDTLGTCSVPPGQTGCYVKKAVIPDGVTVPDAALTESSTIIPADGAIDKPIYLAYRKEFACDSQYLGCQKVGLQETVIPNSTAPSAYKFTEAFVKNNPDSYDQILCAKNQIGCGSFKANNTISYFKDPQTSGAPICVYKDKVEVNGQSLQGWFQEGVGRCTTSGNLCKKDGDCGTNGGTCGGVGTVACYSNYTVGGGTYGIWSNQSPQYNGAVGRCADQYNQCVEIVDPLDKTDEHPKGQPYHVILDQKLQNKIGECDGKVNLKEGCALFDVTTNPTKIYNASTTADKLTASLNPANNLKYAPVDPVSDANNDSNLLLKVVRNRSCSEWLACKDKVRVTDQNGKSRTVCTQYKACRSTVAGEACTSWSPDTVDSVDLLNEKKYISRGVSWYDQDYSGYSLFNKYQINNLVSLTFPDDSLAYLGYEYELPSNDKCANDYLACGPNNSGRCYQKKCILPIAGTFPASEGGNKETMAKFLEGGICKAYPEKTSPFASTVGTQASVFKALNKGGIDRYEYVAKLPGLEGANICQNGNCSCEYQKVTYKSGLTDYYSFPSQKYPVGVCSGGDHDGQSCSLDSDCSVYSNGTLISNGTCSQVKDVQTQIGLRGFCLEYDYSRPINRARNEFACLTWLPVDSAASSYDNFNQYPEAGYYPALDAVTKTADNKVVIAGQVYCTEGSQNIRGVYDKDKFFDTVGLNLYSLGSIGRTNKDFIKIPTEAFCLKGDSSCQDNMHGSYFDASFYARLMYSYAQKHLWIFKDHSPNYWVDWNNGVNKPVIGEPTPADNHNTIVLKTSALPYQYYLFPEKWGEGSINDLAVYADNFVSSAKIIEPEISSLIYLRFLTPGFKSFDVEVSNLILRKLNTKKIAAGSSYSYSFMAESNSTQDIYNPSVNRDLSKISFRAKLDSGQIVLGAMVVVDSNGNPDVGDIKRFAEQAVEDFMSNSPVTATQVDAKNIATLKEWREKDAGNRSVYLVYNVFDQNGDWIAIGKHSAVFQGTSEPGFVSKIVKATSEGHEVMEYMAMAAEVTPRCVEFAQVYDGTKQSTNKAFTNKTWYYTKTYDAKDPYDLATPLKPFGSTELDSNSYMQGENWNSGLRKYVFNDDGLSGRPLACKNSHNVLSGSGFSEGYFFPDETGYCVPRSPIDTTKAAYLKLPGFGSSSLGLNTLLSRYFVQTFAQVEENNSVWQNTSSTDRSATTTDFIGRKLLPPQVYSLDPETCFGSALGGSQACVAKEPNAITVNRRNGTLDDDYIVASGNLTAVANFFAFADQDRMPIKRVAINWGDGSVITNQDRYGSYKNHKPYCMTTPDESSGTTTLKQCAKNTQLTCKSNSDCPGNDTCSESAFTFGNSARACTLDYFEFIHGYSCSQADIDAKESFVYEFGANNNVNGGLTLPAAEGIKLWASLQKRNMNKENTPYVCIFKPKVQVLDNWGWCTGQCLNASNVSQNGCYFNVERVSPSGKKIYEPQCDVSKTESYVNYKGYVVLTP